MTYESLICGIQRLINRRQNADEKEVDLINKKLDKLYNLKYLMIEQRVANEKQNKGMVDLYRVNHCRHHRICRVRTNKTAVEQCIVCGWNIPN